MPNPNTRYANTFVDALVAAGLRRVCITPGSRHTALVLAFTRHGDAINIRSHLDERSAAFFALGQALASGEPAAVVCTSGSAAANFFPAIIEARQSRIPLLVLTADRPHELRASGANQTIDQVKIFGEYADSFVDAPLPEADPLPVALRHLRTLAARAFATARDKGAVVHINLPFRKPFEPGPDDAGAMAIDRRPATAFARRGGAGVSGLGALLKDEVLGRKGIIYLGHGSCRTEREREAMLPWLAGLARVTGFPLLAEASSNLRFTGGGGDVVPISAYESFLAANALDVSQIKVLIRFGTPPLSKVMGDFLADDQLRYHIYCSRAGEWADDSHSVTHQVVLDPAALSAAEWEGMGSRTDGGWQRRWSRLDERTRAIIADEIEAGAYFDGAAVFDIVDLMPPDSALFAGNSLPVRHLDQFGLRHNKSLLAYANRGASGIDGNVSTALGIGAARAGKPLVALLGDITLYHDMNGLLAVKRCGVPVTIVLLNNDGGGIFHRLPVREFEPQFSDYFITAHGLDFSRTAQLFGLEYVRADDRDSFRRAFSESVGSGESTLIELRTDARADLRRRAEIMAALQTRLGSKR